MSNKRVFQRLSCYLIIFLMFSLAVYSFTINSTPESLTICPTTTALITTIVNGEGQYTVTTTGSAARWATSVPLGFVNKGSKTVYTYITPNSNALPGQYDLEITISDGGSVEKVMKTITVLDCFGVNLDESTQQTVCPDETVKYNFDVQNAGNFQEIFSLNVGGNIANWIVLSEDNVDLPSGDSKTIFAYITVPTDARGVYDFNLNVAGTLGGSLDSVASSIDVAGCYDYDVSTEKDFYALCDHTTEIVPIRVENQGTSANDYTLELNAPSWVALDRKSSTLGQGQQDNIDVIISPDYGTEGNFKADVKVIDENGMLETTKHLDLDVRICHDVLVQVQDSDNICAGLSNSYSVLIKNNGEFTQEFKLSKTGENWASLEETLVMLDAGEEREVNLNINPGVDIEGNFNIQIEAENLDGGFAGDDTLSLEVVLQEDCFKPGVTVDEDEIGVGQDSTATVPITIENKGTRASNFVIDISGTAASFVVLNPATVALEPNEADTVFLYIAPKLNDRIGVYTASITLRLEDSAILETDSVTINVLESELLVIPLESEVIEPGTEKNLWQRLVEFFRGEPEEEVMEEIDEELDDDLIDIPDDIEEDLDLDDIDVEDVMEDDVPEEIEDEFMEDVVEDVEIRELMSEGDKITFTVEGVEHTALLDIVIEDGIVLVIESEPILVGLEIGENSNVDLDDDGIDDLLVTFNGFVDGQADITFLSLKASEEVPEVEDVMEETTVSENPLSKYLKSFGPFLNWILIAVIVILLILVLVRYRKQIIDFFEEEDEEDELDEKPKEEVKPVEDVIEKKEEVKKETKKAKKKKISKKK